MDDAAQSIERLLETYNELNASVIDQLHEEPSPLQFMRAVAQNRPFVVRGGCRSWKAVRLWSAAYLNDILGATEVKVAITPHGNADSVVDVGDGKLCFVKPFERNEPFTDLMHDVQEEEEAARMQRFTSKAVKYGQTQNDNLRNEYQIIFADVPRSIPFARIALDKEPDAINFWLGSSCSTTSMHRDSYENVYAQIRGKKHFVLLPPVAAACVNEATLPSYTYHCRELESNDIRKADLEALVDEPAELVQGVVTWDADSPQERSTRFSHLAAPMRVTLNEGDLLYLPACWYHKVSQSCGKEAFCCAVNYWYDMEFSGSFWSTSNYVREAASQAVQRVREQ